jgi:hypothetical protein
MIKQLLTLFSASLLSLSAYALPDAFKANYVVSKGGLTLAEMNVSLSYSNGMYRYYKTSNSRGLVSVFSGDKIVENVVGKYQGEKLLPSNYIYHHTSKRKDRKDQFQFIGNSQVRGTYKDRAYNFTVPTDTLDRASLELAMARDLQAKDPSLVYSVVEKGKQKDYVVKRLGKETITIGGKSYHTEKLTIERDTSERKTIFWLAEEVDYMPVKIEHIEKGTPIQTTLKSFKKH